MGGASRSDQGETELSLDKVPANTVNETARRRQEAPTGGSTRQSMMITESQTPMTPTFDQTEIRNDLTGLRGWRDPVTGADDLGSAEGIARYF